MAAQAQQPGGQGQKLDLTTLPPQHLLQVKKQLDEDLEHLNTSFNHLRAARERFAEGGRCVEGGVRRRRTEQGGEGGGGDESDDDSTNAQILVPLTTSLYVPGRLKDRERVLVDVGTGFYVEKTTDEAITFYNEKVKELQKSLKDLEGVLQQKSNNLRMVEDVLRQKVLQGQAGGQQGQSEAGAAQVGA